MNFYAFHLGDYASHTKHLSLIEDLAYRRMLDLYYTSEKPLPGDVEKIARLIGMRDYVKEVSDVVSDYFLKSEDGYRNKRCDDEIEHYREKANRAIRANKKRWDVKSDKKSDVKSDKKSDLKSDADLIPTSTSTSTNKEVLPQSPQKNEAPPSPPKSGAARTVDPVKDEIWKSGRALLENEGKAKDAAGSFLGKLCKDYGQTLVLDAIRDCVKTTPVTPSEWLVARCQDRRANAGNKQVQLEKRNAAATAGWMPPELRAGNG